MMEEDKRRVLINWASRLSSPQYAFVLGSLMGELMKHPEADFWDVMQGVYENIRASAAA